MKRLVSFVVKDKNHLLDISNINTLRRQFDSYINCTHIQKHTSNIHIQKTVRKKVGKIVQIAKSLRSQFLCISIFVVFFQTSTIFFTAAIEIFFNVSS